MVDEAWLGYRLGKLQNLVGRSQACAALQVGNHSWVEALISDPANFGALHRIPKPHACQIVSRWSGVVGELVGERPASNVFNGNRLKLLESAEIVVGLEGFCCNRCSSTLELVMGCVLASPQRSKGGNGVE